MRPGCFTKSVVSVLSVPFGKFPAITVPITIFLVFFFSSYMLITKFERACSALLSYVRELGHNRLAVTILHLQLLTMARKRRRDFRLKNAGDCSLLLSLPCSRIVQARCKCLHLALGYYVEFCNTIFRMKSSYNASRTFRSLIASSPLLLCSK